jgi:hypothetical protein
MKVFTKKFEATAAANELRAAGHVVGLTEVMIKRRPLPFDNIIGWKLIVDGEISA